MSHTRARGSVRPKKERTEKAPKSKPAPPGGATPPHRARHRDHRTGRLVLGRAAARQGLRSRGRRAPHVARLVRADRAPARSRPHRAGRPPRPALPYICGARRQARRGLQPRRPELRADLVEPARAHGLRSEEHTSELQSRLHLVCRLLLEKKKTAYQTILDFAKSTCYSLQSD